jgi:hypothetical protein
VCSLIDPVHVVRNDIGLKDDVDPIIGTGVGRVVDITWMTSQDITGVEIDSSAIDIHKPGAPLHTENLGAAAVKMQRNGRLRLYSNFLEKGADATQNVVGEQYSLFVTLPGNPLACGGFSPNIHGIPQCVTR